MSSFSILTGLIGGLGMFLYGMKLMGDGLENAAGERLKSILERLTSNNRSFSRSSSYSNNSKLKCYYSYGS